MGRLTPPRPLTVADDCSAFNCGRQSMNQWFRRHAQRNQEGGVTRTTVVCDAASGEIAAYVSLSTCQIERAWLPKSAQRNQPDPLPAILLGQLAVDVRHQGKGYAAELLRFALSTAVRISGDIGCFAVLTHPLDETARAFYRHFGFDDLPFDPGRSMTVRIKDLVHAGF